MSELRWSPLGESAVLVWCDDEAAAAMLAARVRDGGFSWVVDVVQAYASVAVYFEGVTHDEVMAAFRGDKFPNLSVEESSNDLAIAGHGQVGKLVPTLHVIPVCYEKSLDLDRVAQHTGLDRDAVIRLHTETIYTVYAIGFCPGFPYLGYLPSPLAGVPRLETPRLRVPVGSVGLTGRQTGIYTEPRPGGWNIVGQTPLVLVDVADGYFPLRTSDTVRFERIDEAEFAKRAGERL